MSDAKQWLRDAAQRIADHNDGTWCSKSWRIIADAFELVGDDPDAKLDLVAVMFDEIAALTARLASAEAANKELAASAVDGVKYRGLVKDYNQLTVQLAAAEAALREILDRAEDDDVVSCIAIASKAIGLRMFVGNPPTGDDEAAKAGGCDASD